MKDRYYAGFMTDKPQFLKKFARGFSLIRRRLFVSLTDLIALLYLWTMTSYAVNALFYHVKSYSSLPWWVMLIVVVEATALWENFGVSIGMRLLGLRLSPAADDNLARHFVRYLLWHFSPFFLLPLLWRSDYIPLHERVSGLKTVRVSEVEETPRPWYTRSWSVGMVVILVVTLVTASLITKVDLRALLTGASKTAPVWNKFLHPDLSIVGDGVSLLIVTIYMAFMATLFAVIVAIPLSFFAARNLTHGIIGRTIYMIVRISISITRSIDAIIWAIIFLVWVRVGAFPGVLALFVHSIADLTKLYSERLESIDPGPVEAIRATGANRLQVILYGIIPQIVNPYLSFTLYRWDINVRMATIIGIVGGGGIGQRLIQYMKVWDYRSAGTLMLLIMITVWIIDYTSSRLRARLS